MPTRLFARRYSADGGDDQPWTSFHFDSAHTTVNVALTDDDSFEGGELLALLGQRLSNVTDGHDGARFL